MNADERAIRELIDEWMRASIAGDRERVLDLMTDDVRFLVAGRREPMTRAEFAQANAGGPRPSPESRAEVQEIGVRDDLGYCWSRLRVVMTGPDGATVRRSGFTLTVFRKGADGRWRLARDANLLAPDPAV
jgi:uncharacterized protein (TIGR02246 family)